MNDNNLAQGRHSWRGSRRAALALIAALVLTGGAVWRGAAADKIAAQPAPIQTVSESTVTGRAAALAHDSFADVVQMVEPAVVTIRTEGKARVAPTVFQGDEFLRRFFGEDFDGERPRMRVPRQRGLGSGVIVSTDGYVLTNNHVVDHADVVKVDLPNNRTVEAKVVGTDKPSDLALLKIPGGDLHPVALGNSDSVKVGDVVLAVGNPLGIGKTVTMGIISAKGRSTGVGDGGYEDFLQTDAPINHGNSGGALVNTRGELVGINSQILSPSDGNIGIGFAIPVNMARNVMDQLKTSGRVERAQLGVTVQPVTSDIAASLGLKEAGGAIVSAVDPGSAAATAGVKQGDVISSFNGQPVTDTNTLRNRVAESRPGSTATLSIVRDGGEKTVTVTLDAAKSSRTARLDSEPEGQDKTALGISVVPVTPELAARAGAPKGTQGVIVEGVNPEGRAAAAGVQPGDIIEQVNRKPIQNVDDLRAALRGAPDRPLLLLVARQGRELFLTVPSA